MYVPSNPKAYDQAKAELIRAENLYRATCNGPRDECAEKLSLFVPTSLQEHWKSGNEPGVSDEDDHWKLYVVKGLKWSEGGVLEVEYAALYRPHTGGPAGELFTRPLLDPEEGFLVPINRPRWKPWPYVGPRFSFIRPLSPKQIDMLLDEAETIAMCHSRAAALELIGAMLGS